MDRIILNKNQLFDTDITRNEVVVKSVSSFGYREMTLRIPPLKSKL